ncbi:MAG: cytochrome c-type biogenesis protein CcmH [Deltaproteobacteria bacterium]|nr:cytochrome c-type biogenesis protein CcmH [Deltaproteobacteria bacterium]
MRFCILVFGVLALTSNLTTREERELIQFYKSIRSPYCPSRSLLDCPTLEAENLKQEIKEMFIKGLSKQQILELLFKKYSKEKLGYSEDNRNFWLSYAPFLLFCIILVAFVFKIRGQTKIK